MMRCGVIGVIACALAGCGAEPNDGELDHLTTAVSEGTSAVNYKLDLLLNPRNNCERGASAVPGFGTPGYGFAQLHARDGYITAHVLLRNVRPSTSYTVYLIQSAGLGGGIFDCYEVDATITTDARGNAGFKLDEAILPGATQAHVYMYTAGPVEMLDTFVVPLTPDAEVK